MGMLSDFDGGPGVFAFPGFQVRSRIGLDGNGPELDPHAFSMAGLDKLPQVVLAARENIGARRPVAHRVEPAVIQCHPSNPHLPEVRNHGEHLLPSVVPSEAPGVPLGFIGFARRLGQYRSGGGEQPPVGLQRFEEIAAVKKQQPSRRGQPSACGKRTPQSPTQFDPDPPLGGDANRNRNRLVAGLRVTDGHSDAFAPDVDQRNSAAETGLGPEPIGRIGSPAFERFRDTQVVSLEMAGSEFLKAMLPCFRAAVIGPGHPRGAPHKRGRIQ